MNKILFISAMLMACIITALFLTGLGHRNETSNFTQKDPDFENYWYQGKAEISSYTLEQSRYGEIHPGDAVLVFVTEDFSKSKQVKLDQPDLTPRDAVKVLKLNFIKKFNTGIYDYSMLNSVFTPVYYQQYPNTIKVTTSSQEWCGHTFSQLNLKNNQYHIGEYSYFESEGDRDYYLNKTWLEDEIWNIIRIAPQNLPLGKFQMIPGTFYARLTHKKLHLQQVEASLSTSEANPKFQKYTLVYPQYNRKLTIEFEKEFPHKISAWEESYPAPTWDSNAKTLTTKASLKKTILSDYWTKHNLEDAGLRKELGLSY